MNLFLKGLKHSGDDVNAYADDIAIAASRICPQTLPDKYNLALSIVLDWCMDIGLSINTSLTDTILFTRRYKIPNFSLSSICRTKLTLSPEVKYLSLTLDSKPRRHVFLTAVNCILRSSNPTPYMVLLSGGLF